MAILLATGHLEDIGFVVGEPRTCVLYRGGVYSVPPWGLDSERIDCMRMRGRPDVRASTVLCTLTKPCPRHERFASGAEQAIAEDKATRKLRAKAIAEGAHEREGVSDEHGGPYPDPMEG